jgi:hypothetical protein
MNKLFFIILMISVSLLACKEGGLGLGKGKEAPSLPVNDQFILSNQESMNDSLVQVHRRAAEAIINNRIKESASNTTNVLEKDNWHIEAFLKGSNMSFGSDVKGFWIDFQEKNNYQYGSFDKTLGSGKYHYGTDTNLLLFIDADSRIKPQEFKVLNNGDGLVLQGHVIYADNNMQVKMNRKAGFPVKPAATPVQ